MLILPVILCLIAGKQHRHVRHIIGKKISSDLMLFERMCHTSALSYDIFRFIQSGEQHHLDNFKNRQVKEKDYSIGEVLQPDGRYAMYYEGGEKIILSPNEELVKVLKSVAPRKVFSE